MDFLSDIEAFAASAILEEMLDKLKVMRHILPPIVTESKEDDLTAKPSPHLRTRLDTVKESGVGYNLDAFQASEPDDEAILQELIGRKFCTLPRDELHKAQMDRTYIEGVLTETLDEICEKRSFNILKRRIDEAMHEKRCLEHIVEREAEADAKIASLTRDLNVVKVTRANEVGRRKRRLAFLKNELQELKAKSRMEDSFLMKSTNNEVDWTNKRNSFEEGRLTDEIATLNKEIEKETRINVEMESFIGLHQAELEQQVEMWMDKYEKDYDNKIKELDTLKKMMAADKERLEELTVLYAEYENIIVKDRIDRERERRRREKERRENEATLRIQSWWRGVIIRKGMRLMKPPKKKKGKKGRRK